MRVARAFAIACVVATVAAPCAAAAQTSDSCAAPRALAAAHQLAAAQTSYKRLLNVDAPPSCAGKELAGVLASRAKARGLLRDARAAEDSDREKALGLYRDALAIEASLPAAADALAKPSPKAKNTLHDVGNDVGGWADRRASDLGNALMAVGIVLGALLLVLAVLALLGAVLLRIGPIKRHVRRTAWNLRRKSLLAAGGARRRLIGFLCWLWKPLAWGTATPLRVEELKASNEGDGKAATHAIAGLLPTVTTRGAGGVDLVATPFAAKTALEEVSDVLSGVPQGKIAAAALKLARRALPRDTLHLSGSLLESPLRGAGLALSLVDEAGNVIASTVLWAGEFDPYPEPGADKEAEGQRMLRLARGGATWAEFTALRHHGALGDDDDWRRHLGTRDWKSYALGQIAFSERNGRSALVTQADYARAIDRDPHNLHAIFNLANVDLQRSDNVQARRRFNTVTTELGAREEGRGLLQRDPVRYQAAYGRAVAIIEIDDDYEQILGARDEFMPYVLDLELSLAELDGGGGGRDAAELRGLLRGVEGPLLVLWAYLDARLAVHDRDKQDPARGNEPLRTADAEELKREELIKRLTEEKLRHGTLVRNFVHKHVDLGPRTQYNLASYYTATRNMGKARAALEEALELGTLTDTAVGDRQLRPLRRADRRKFDKLVDVYRAADATGLGAVAAIGPELGAKLAAMSLDSADKLVAAADTPDGCANLAADLEIGPSLVERWVRLLRMQQRVNMEISHLNLLDTAEVDSLGALAPLTAKRLRELLKGVAGSDDVPRTATLQGWIDRATGPVP